MTDDDRLNAVLEDVKCFLAKLTERHDLAGVVVMYSIPSSEQKGVTLSNRHYRGAGEVAYALCKRFTIEQEALWHEDAAAAYREELE